MKTDKFEQSIRELTRPLNGQLPRPWMTKLSNPLSAEIFIVGKNQRNGYPASDLPHERHMDGLFNRNGETCRRIYEEITQGKSSPTRKNTDALVNALEEQGTDAILETNVICYSTPMSSDLRLSNHSGGSARGEEIFRHLLEAIKPKVLIVHGASARSKLGGVLGLEILEESEEPDEVIVAEAGSCYVIPMKCLAPPAYNKWSWWALPHFHNVAITVSKLLKR